MSWGRIVRTPATKSSRIQTTGVKKGGSPSRRPSRIDTSLFDCGRDIAEGSGEIAAKRVDRDNDDGGNAGGDQAIFNRGGTRFFLPEPNKKLRHADNPVLGLPLDAPSAATMAKLPLYVSKITYRNLIGKYPKKCSDFRRVR